MERNEKDYIKGSIAGSESGYKDGRNLFSEYNDNISGTEEYRNGYQDAYYESYFKAYYEQVNKYEAGFKFGYENANKSTLFNTSS